MNLNDDKDTIILSQCDLIEKLRANLIRHEGVISNLEEENRQLKEYIKDCYIQEYAGARYSCKHCTRLEDQGHYSHCPIVRFGLEKEQAK